MARNRNPQPQTFSGKFTTAGTAGTTATRPAYQYKVWGEQPTTTAPPRSQPTTGHTTDHIPSLNPADTPEAVAIATASTSATSKPKYTGTACLGVAVMHKSNLVPIFNQQQAIDTATMRRG